MYPTHAVSTTTTIKSSLHNIHSCAYCTYGLTQTKLATVSFACYYRITRRRSGAGPPRNAHLCIITHQMNAQRARLRPTYYSLATAGGANKIHSSTWVLSDTNRLATVQPHSAVHEQTASLQPHPKGLPIYQYRHFLLQAYEVEPTTSARSSRRPRQTNPRSSRRRPRTTCS